MIKRASAALAAKILLAAGLLAIGSYSAVAQEMKVLSSWSPGLPNGDLILGEATRRIETGTQGRLKISVVGPEVVPPFEQLEPVSQGLFAFLLTNGTMHAGTTGIGMIASILEPTKDTLRKSGVWEWIDRYYQKNHNLKLLLITTEPGFQLLLSKMPKTDSLVGMKVRSHPAVDEPVKQLGGAPVHAAAGEVYTGIQKGVFDGLVWPMLGTLSMRFDEVTHYFVRPPIGTIANIWFMNLDKWNALSPEDKTLIAQIGLDIEQLAYDRIREIVIAEEQELLKRGKKRIDFSPAADEAMQAAYVRGIVAIAKRRDPKSADELVALITSRNVSLVRTKQ